MFVREKQRELRYKWKKNSVFFVHWVCGCGTGDKNQLFCWQNYEKRVLNFNWKLWKFCLRANDCRLWICLVASERDKKRWIWITKWITTSKKRRFLHTYSSVVWRMKFFDENGNGNWRCHTKQLVHLAICYSQKWNKILKKAQPKKKQCKGNKFKSIRQIPNSEKKTKRDSFLFGVRSPFLFFWRK